MRVLIFLVPTIAFTVAGCISNTTSEVEPPQNGEIILNEDLESQINSAPDTLIINGEEYALEAVTWRDFMPSINPPVRLISNSTLIRVDENTIQRNIEIIQQFVIRDDEIWIPEDFEIRSNQSSPNRLHIISREGPTWEIGSEVVVALKIRHEKTEEAYFLSAQDVPIEKTE